MLQQYLISIDARLRSRNSTVSVKAETAECLVARDKRIETFQIFEFSDSGRFLCVNASFGASIHLILFFVSIRGKQNRKKSVEFTKGIVFMHK